MYVGLDYHQDSIQVCAMNASANVIVNRACANDPQAVMAMLGDAADAVRLVAIEACTGAADFAEALATRSGWSVALAHPTYVARLKGSPDKSDFSDSRLLADLGRVGYLPRTWLAPAYLRDLRQLAHHRQRLVDQRRNLKLQIGAMLRDQRVKIEHAGRWSRSWVQQVRVHPKLSESVRWLIEENLAEIEHRSERLANIEQRLEQATANDAVIERLQRIEGIGRVTAWCLRAFIGRFDRFGSAKQLCRYCGLSPRNASSGQRVSDGGLIQAANRQLRAVLIQAAHRLIRTDERWRTLAGRMLDRGKAKNVVVAAIANRWMRTVHHRMVSEPKPAN